MTAPDRGATYKIALASTGSSTHNTWLRAAIILPDRRPGQADRARSGRPASLDIITKEQDMAAELRNAARERLKAGELGLGIILRQARTVDIARSGRT